LNDNWPFPYRHTRTPSSDSDDTHILQTILTTLFALPTTLPGIWIPLDSPLVITTPFATTLTPSILEATQHLGVHHVHIRNDMDVAIAGLCTAHSGERRCNADEKNMVVLEATENAVRLHLPGRKNREEGDKWYTLDREGGAMLGWAIASYARAHVEGSEKLVVLMIGGRDIRAEVTEAVTDALSEVSNDVEVVGEGTEYLVARSAAELAWRMVRTDGDGNLEL
jgi:hypothetical protein